MTGKAVKKIIIPLLIIIGITFFVLSRKSNSQVQEEVSQSKNPVVVGVQSVADSKNATGKIKYAGVISGDQEVKITAPTAGVATAVNFDLGDSVAIGKQLVRIDDQGTALDFGGSGFRSSQIQQLEFSVEQAKKSLNLAKKNYNSDKSRANNTAKQLAEIQYENAQVALAGAINSHQVTAPISGVVTNRQISVGDSVSQGQLLATISKTNMTKVQFYVDKAELPNFSLKSMVTVNDGRSDVSAQIINIAPIADETTRRFLIEAVPTSGKFIIGTVVNVFANIDQKSDDSNAYILPLSAITIVQNENYIFIAQNNVAKKITVEVTNVNGEMAEVKGDIPANGQIIVEGNKLLKDGDEIQIKN